MAAYWLNVDTAGTCTLHKHACDHVVNMEATDKKFIGSLGPNGGWLPFPTAEATAAARRAAISRLMMHVPPAS